MRISKRIYKLRLERRLTIKATAQLLGVPASTYRDWEYGRKIPAECLPGLAETFGVSVGELLDPSSAHPNELLKVTSLLEEALSMIRKAIARQS
jgi:transcriptional regulator with XRE-family HTH domain